MVLERRRKAIVAEGDEYFDSRCTMNKDYDDALAKLVDKDGNPTPHYKAYMQYEEGWNSKVAARQKAYASARTDPMKLQAWPIDGVIYHDEVNQAFDRWTALGYKQEIENAIAILKAQGTDPATIGGRRKR